MVRKEDYMHLCHRIDISRNLDSKSKWCLYGTRTALSPGFVLNFDFGIYLVDILPVYISILI